jgi:hypothetical protein
MDTDDIVLLAAAFKARRGRRRRPALSPRPFAATRRPIEEWLSSPTLLFNATGLRLVTIQRLCAWLRDHANIENARSKITLEEKVLMFLHICRKGAGFRETQITFNHSTDTISRSFHSILDALVQLHKEVVRQPESHDPTPTEIVENPKLFPFFQDCIGAVDGTHVHAFIPAAEAGPWRNRKGFHSQNVFAACSFDLRFTFVYPGWEGSAHDSTVVGDALAKGHWRPPIGKYFLADAGYTTSEYLLIPYNKTRYHLREQAAANLRPQNKEELFNLRHAQLRNAIERIFGVLKKKFSILASPVAFSIDVQVDLVLALTGLFNFISDNERLGDEDFTYIEQYDTDGISTKLAVTTFAERRSSARRQMIEFRDQLASKMWIAYQHYITTRFQ